MVDRPKSGRKGGGGGGKRGSSNEAGMTTGTGRRGSKVNGGGGARQTRRQAQRVLDPSDPETTERMLNSTLKSMGLYASKTVGDGNCMFRALSDQVWGNDNGHLGLRQEICDYMQAHPKSFEGFVDTERPFDHYLSVMRQRGTYGGHMELTAFARCKGRAVKVIMPEHVYIILPRDESPTPLEDASTNTLRALPHGTSASDLEGNGGGASASSSTSMGQGEGEAVKEDGMVYVSYHIFEHYSSVRNLAGPHKGLPKIKEAALPTIVENNRASTSTTDPAIEESVKFVLRSLPPDHAVPEDRIRQRLGRGDAWEMIVDDLLTELGAEEDEDAGAEGSERSVSMVEARLGKDEADLNHAMTTDVDATARSWSIDSDDPRRGSHRHHTHHHPHSHLAYRDGVGSPYPSSGGSNATGTPTGSTDGRKIKPMGKPRLDRKARRETVEGEDGVDEDDQRQRGSSLDSLVASQESRTGSTVSIGGSDESQTTGSTCPLPGESGTPASTSVTKSPARPTHGRKRQLTSASANDQSSRRVTRSRQASGSGPGSAPNTPTRRTFSVLGKNMKKVPPQNVELDAGQENAVPTEGGVVDSSDVLRGKAKREARKRRAEIGRRERIEAEAWGLGGGGAGGNDEPDEGTGRKTRGGAVVGGGGGLGKKKEEGEGAIKGIKELYI